MIKTQNLVFLYCLFFICACQSDSKNTVARYKDYTLTKTELRSVIPTDTSKEDSTELANNYIENWLKQKVLLENSTHILSDERKLEIDTKVEEYKNDLITNALEDKWLAENTPTPPTENEIKEFYAQNPDIMPVKNTVVEYLFINLPKNQVEKIKPLLQKNELDSLKKIVIEKKYPAQIEKEKWIKWEDLLKILSLPNKTEQTLYLKKNKTFKIPKEDNIILLKVVDYALQGQSAPLSYAKKTLKSILLNKRKLNLLSKKKEELYQKAIYNNEIERN